MSHMLRFSLIFLTLALTFWSCDQKPASTPTTPTAATPADSNQASTQKPLKIGYVNSVEMLALMPDAVAADEAISNYAAGQERRFQNLMQEYQTKVQEVQEQGASMTPMKQQVAMQEIQKLEKQLQDMQENSQQRMANRRNELLSPVMARADSIIRAVAQEHDYDLIYDSPTLLYADSSLNVMPLIRKALGVDEEEGESEE